MNQHDYPRGHVEKTYESTLPRKGEPATEAQRILGRLDVVREYVLKLRDRSERIVTRAFGEVPEPAKDQPRAIPAGAIGALDERIGDILGEIDRLDATITRLDGLV